MGPGGTGVWGISVTAAIRIDAAQPDDAPAIAPLVGALLDEIMQAIGAQAFHFNLVETTARLQAFIEQGHYHVLVARCESEPGIIGFATLYESFALYAEGAFGTLAELYVSPAHRSHGIGTQLIDAAKSLAQDKAWKRLEVTTPPLPQFDRTLAFYEREGFSVAGGKKLKLAL
jgi:GNAT superfamily N-acetyltransferase